MMSRHLASLMETSSGHARDDKHGAARRGGFTLLELLVVMAVLAVMALLVTPSFDALLENAVVRETRRLNGVLRLLRNEAVLRGESYRVVFVLPQSQWRVERITYEGDLEILKRPKYLQPRSLPSGMRLIRMEVLEQQILGSDGVVHIDPSGFSDTFQLWVDYRGDTYLLKSEGFTGSIALVNEAER